MRELVSKVRLDVPACVAPRRSFILQYCKWRSEIAVGALEEWVRDTAMATAESLEAEQRQESTDA